MLSIQACYHTDEGWTEVERRAVAPDYVVPAYFDAEDVDAYSGVGYRVAPLDDEGRIIDTRSVEH